MSNTEEGLTKIYAPFNGIDNITMRPDLNERSIIVNLPMINKKDRKESTELKATFEEDYIL